MLAPNRESEEFDIASRSAGLFFSWRTARAAAPRRRADAGRYSGAWGEGLERSMYPLDAYVSTRVAISVSMPKGVANTVPLGYNDFITAQLRRDYGDDGMMRSVEKWQDG
uniref:Uncharacterized protein n=1 Tax=Rhodosorus marinus TaxID=101924 RepID=A0A7S2ZAP2_9RHOD|mmetsp:Transcript_12407/g.50808  ORF Transcript_12407/g.50808 Transcript_12407/m.50808 type:complete len:110 (+) Transcript_12407:715-1044(+)|eukprot:CAMPEP_0113962866 /NCGR_PEP_ID=MMETSP0011_2-20120614/6182_1 /TAXON_ID=101924 /ORGANISM="Rhodosorus marinus" /LENGTH=109 /DNA_ID=CAMNT_0000974825 /DNA_START=462 /DNA_END=791 /DNA_ORIENTATION=- /assembly_acc=CAM_ASM_000156